MDRPGHKRAKGEHDEIDDADSFADSALTLDDMPPQARTEMHSGIVALGQLALQTATMVEKIGWRQKQLSLMASAEHIAEHTRLHVECAREVQNGLRLVAELRASSCLAPTDLFQLANVHIELVMQWKQLELYDHELRHLLGAEPGRPQCFAALVIVKQPFPKSLKQNIKTSASAEDPVVVRLISGARTEVRPMSPVKAELLHEDYAPKKGELGVQNDSQELDARGFATFSAMRFPQGTRIKAVRLQFAVQVHFANPMPHDAPAVTGVALVQSEPSAPFVVMTNENQWDVSAGLLLQRELFSAVAEAPWPVFANVLQMHYIKATRQDPLHPLRCLSAAELAYIHEVKFERRPTIYLRDFERFWDWCGKVFHRIRHQRQLALLWLRGLIFGFCTKEDAEELLRPEQVGTFLLRFSERIAGQFAIAYVAMNKASGEREVKHYLLKPDDIAGPNKTIADFLRVHDKFLFVVEKRLDFAPQPPLVVARHNKDVVLDEFYTKKNFTAIAGYEDELVD